MIHTFKSWAMSKILESFTWSQSLRTYHSLMACTKACLRPVF